MKKIVIIIVAFVGIIFMPFGMKAQENDAADFSDFGVRESIEDSLDNDTKEFLEAQDIRPDDYNSINNLTAKNVFSYVFSLLKGGAAAPLKAGFSCLGIILLAASIKVFGSENGTGTATKFCVTLSICAVLTGSVWGSINAAVNAVKGSSMFMLSFAPSYMAIVSVSGAPVTAAASGGLILGAAEFVSSIAAFGITAVMGAYLSLSICSAVSPILNGAGFSECLKRVGMWTMSLCTTVFLGLLSLGTAVNTAADSLTAKTAKYILGTCVPFVGPALSGAVNTVSASLSLLKSSVGIYGVIVLCVMLFPILAELLIWRIVLNVLSGISTLFETQENAKLFRAVDGMIAFLVGAVFLVAAAFIISLFVTVKAGRGL